MAPNMTFASFTILIFTQYIEFSFGRLLVKY